MQLLLQEKPIMVACSVTVNVAYLWWVVWYQHSVKSLTSPANMSEHRRRKHEMPVHLLLPSRVTWLLEISWFYTFSMEYGEPQLTKENIPGKHPRSWRALYSNCTCLLLIARALAGLGVTRGRWCKGKKIIFRMSSYSWIYLPLAWQALRSALLPLQQQTSQLYSFLPLAAIRQNSIWKHFPVLKWRGILERRLFFLFI